MESQGYSMELFLHINTQDLNRPWFVCGGWYHDEAPKEVRRSAPFPTGSLTTPNRFPHPGSLTTPTLPGSLTVPTPTGSLTTPTPTGSLGPPRASKGGDDQPPKEEMTSLQRRR